MENQYYLKEDRENTNFIANNMKFLEMLEAEIKKQKKVDMLMTRKRQLSDELGEVNKLLRQLIYKKR